MTNGNVKEPPIPQEKPDVPNTNAYDILMFIVKSFGKTLPVVVVIGLIAYGAIYTIREMASLQGHIIKVQQELAKIEIAKAQAEAATKSAEEKAKYDALQDYSKKLTEMTKDYATVLDKMQHLVSSQLENMEKNEKIAKIRDEKAIAYQQQLEKAAEQELINLKSEIETTKKNAQEQYLKATLSSYESIKQIIVARLENGHSIDNQMIELLNTYLVKEEIQKQAEFHRINKSITWKYRVLLGIQLYKITSNYEYAVHFESLILQNKGNADYTISALFIATNFSEQQRNSIIPILIGFVLDKGFTEYFRQNLISLSIINMDDDLCNHLHQEQLGKLIYYCGDLLINKSADPDSYCIEIQRLLSLLDKLSIEKKKQYAQSALRIPIGNIKDQECITTTLEAAAASN